LNSRKEKKESNERHKKQPGRPQSNNVISHREMKENAQQFLTEGCGWDFDRNQKGANKTE